MFVGVNPVPAIRQPLESDVGKEAPDIVLVVPLHEPGEVTRDEQDLALEAHVAEAGEAEKKLWLNSEGLVRDWGYISRLTWTEEAKLHTGSRDPKFLAVMSIT